MLEAAFERTIERCIVASTSEVCEAALYPPIDEKHPLQGRSPYSATKIGAGPYCPQLSQGGSIYPVTVVQPFQHVRPARTRAIYPDNYPPGPAA